jgi:hypothetical protein
MRESPRWGGLQSRLHRFDSGRRLTAGPALKVGSARVDYEFVARLLQSAIALLALAAVLIAGPIGSGGVAAAATGGGQESRLEREVDRLSAGQRAQLVRQLSDRLAEAGIDLEAPAVQVRLARVLGVPVGEIGRAVEGSGGPVGGSVASGPVAFLFVVVALIFAPSVFQSIGGTLFEWLAEVKAIDGVKPFGG